MTLSDPTKEIAKLLAGRLIERRDVKAVQQKDGAYHPDHEPFTLADLIAHVEGKRTYGHYVVSKESTCRMICFDVDLVPGRRLEAPFPEPNPPIYYHDGWPDQVEIWPRDEWTNNGPHKVDLACQLRVLTQGLAERIRELLDVPAMVAYSGSKGMHAYGILEPGTPAADARELAMMVLDTIGEFEPERGKNFFRHKRAFTALSIEVFPKQTEIRPDGGLGNLIRLPLGINQKSGRAGFFLDLGLPMNKFAADDPLVALREGSLR